MHKHTYANAGKYDENDDSDEKKGTNQNTMVMMMMMMKLKMKSKNKVRQMNAISINSLSLDKLWKFSLDLMHWAKLWNGFRYLNKILASIGIMIIIFIKS